MSGNFLDDSDFLRNHEPQIRDFLTTIHGHLDHAIEEPNNDGMLTIPINDDNLRATRWQTTPPELPKNLQKLLPFGSDDQIEVHARYRYGRCSALINVWVSSLDKGPDFKSFSLGLSVDPQTGKVDGSSPMNQAGSDHTKHIDIQEDDARAVMNALFAKNDAYQEQSGAATLDIASLFQLGIATQTDCGAELYTVESAGKVFAVVSRSGEVKHLNGFDLSVRVVDRAHPNKKPSKTYVTLRRHFEPDDYSPEGIYTGMLTQGIEIEQDVHGRVISIKRESTIHLFNEPSVTEVNGKNTVMSGASHITTDLPEQLTRRLYPNSTPILSDLAYFERLVTKPITSEDCYI